MNLRHILYYPIGASILFSAGCHSSDPPVNVKMWTSTQRSLYAGTVFYEGAPRNYPEHAVAWYHVAGEEIDNSQVQNHFREAVTKIRHDFCQQYAKRKIVWDASKWSIKPEEQPKDFNSVRGIVIGLIAHDQPPVDSYDNDSHVEYIVILDVAAVFDKSSSVENIVRDAVVHRNSFHRRYDEATRRFLSNIGPLEGQTFKGAAEDKSQENTN